jgi:hypothetical protein
MPLAAYQQLLWEAAQGDLLHNDDTHMRVLEGATKAKKGEPLGPRCRRHRKNSLFYKTQQGADVGDALAAVELPPAAGARETPRPPLLPLFGRPAVAAGRCATRYPLRHPLPVAPRSHRSRCAHAMRSARQRDSSQGYPRRNTLSAGAHSPRVHFRETTGPRLDGTIEPLREFTAQRCSRSGREARVMAVLLPSQSSASTQPLPPLPPRFQGRPSNPAPLPSPPVPTNHPPAGPARFCTVAESTRMLQTQTVFLEDMGMSAAQLIPCLLVPVERESATFLATADAAAKPPEFRTGR